MYEKDLWKIMKVYEHRDEYPQKIHETLHLYNIKWDEDDLEESPELSDTQFEDVDIEYIQNYEGDHSNRYPEIDKYFIEFYGYVPQYEVEVVNCEGIDESSENPSDDGEGNQEDELANAIYYSDKRDLMDAIVGMLNSISTLDKNAFTKVRNEFYSLQRGKESELKKALLNAMDFLLNS